MPVIDLVRPSLVTRSEFGMPSMPSLSTIDHWMGSMRDDQKERYAQAPIMGQHCRAGQYERRFAIPMNESFRLTSDLETCVVTNVQTSWIPSLKASMFSGTSIIHSLCSQRLLVMLIVFGGESGGGRERNSYVLQTSQFQFHGYSNSSFFQTAGVIVWQLNDCWPVTSWAIVDYFVSIVTALLGMSIEHRLAY